MSAEDSVTDQPAQATALAQPRHESPLTCAEDWFHGREGQAVTEELKPWLQGHFAGVFALASKVLGSPELKAIAPEVLELAGSAARIAGVAL